MYTWKQTVSQHCPVICPPICFHGYELICIFVPRFEGTWLLKNKEALLTHVQMYLMEMCTNFGFELGLYRETYCVIIMVDCVIIKDLTTVHGIQDTDVSYVNLQRGYSWILKTVHNKSLTHFCSNVTMQDGDKEHHFHGEPFWRHGNRHTGINNNGWQSLGDLCPAVAAVNSLYLSTYLGHVGLTCPEIV